LLTGDRDAYQLIKKNVSVIFTTAKNRLALQKIVTEETIREKYGIEPKKFIDVKAIAGDHSDNIPGCRGIGEKTALALISQFGNIENLFENLNQITSENIRKKLTMGKEAIFLGKRLVEIRLDVPIDCSIDAYIPKKTDKQALITRLSELDMRTAIEKISILVPHLEEQGNCSTALDDPAITLNSVESLEDINDELRELSKVYISLSVANNNLGINTGETIYILPLASNTKAIAKFFVRFHGQIYIDNIKTFFKYLARARRAINLFGSPIAYVPFCINLAGYVLDSLRRKYDTARLVKVYLPPGRYVRYASDDFIFGLVNSPALCSVMEQELEERNQMQLLKQIEVPFAEVLVAMEEQGFMLDVKGLVEFGQNIDKETARIEKEIFKYNNNKAINLNSNVKLGQLLFEVLKLPSQGLNKTGFKTDAESLHKIAHQHPIVNLILEYRTLVKLKTTYISNLLKLADANSHIHTTFNQTETKTGRISSSEPNLQSIPIKTEQGSRLRKFFIAEPGYVIIDADYSQIELRILAELSQDDVLINMFRAGQDVHCMTAAEIFGVPWKQVTPELRRTAKVVNFGIIYGMGAAALAEELGITTKKAANFIYRYSRRFPDVAIYNKKVIAFAEEQGFVKTLFGRRIYIPELNSRSGGLPALGRRIAYNAPIQGTAADIIKIAMSNLQNKLKEEGLSSKIIMQVHDEVILQTPEEEKEITIQVLRKSMERAATLIVPLKVDIGCGQNWYDAKKS
jgi:DNA polymerase-1